MEPGAEDGGAKDGRRGAPTPVVLNVYDISAPNDPALIPNINSWISAAGLGIYHSGVEVRGREWCFGGHPDAGTGVFVVPPRGAPDARFREAIPLGECSLDDEALAQLLDVFSAHWPGNGYNLLTRNCNHFASELAVALTGAPAPAWVNRLALIGERFKPLLPAGFDTPMMAPVTEAAAAVEAAEAAAAAAAATSPGNAVAAEEQDGVLLDETRRHAAADDPDHDFLPTVSSDMLSSSDVLPSSKRT